MKTLRSLIIVLFVCVSMAGFAQKTEVIYMRVQESIASTVCNSFIQITFADNTSKTIELEKIKMSGSGSVENGKKIQATLNELVNSGYSITASSVGCDINLSTTVIILTRKKEN